MVPLPVAHQLLKKELLQHDSRKSSQRSRYPLFCHQPRRYCDRQWGDPVPQPTSDLLQLAWDKASLYCPQQEH